MKTSFWRRWYNSLRSVKPTRSVSRRRPRRQPLGLEVLEDRVTPSLTPQMVLDINPNTASSNPSQLVAVGSTTYFTADDGVHGVELWKSDGTAAGTTLVKDINPGGSSNPGSLTNVNGTLFFTADDGTHGLELWKSDGTQAGTVLVKDIYPGGVGSYSSDLTNVNGTLYFSAQDGTVGLQLWKSDGTAAGTVQVSQVGVNNVINGVGASNLTNVNGTLFFTGAGADGVELWKSDGTAAGTVQVKDIYPGGSALYPGGYSPNGSGPSGLTNINGTLFFSAYNGTSGNELWKSDGTTAGTVLVKDIDPGQTYYPRYGYYGNSSSPSNLTNVNGTLFFTADDGTTGDELWKSDGTQAGTVLVKDINPGGGHASPSSLTNVNGTLYFSASGGTTGTELWKSDGTAAGTVLVKDMNSGSASSSPDNLTYVNGTLFFTADDGTGVKLWQSDGTPAGTVPVANLAANSLTNVNGTLFFSADDGIHGQELWMLVNGPAQGTSLKVSGFPATITAGTAGNFTVTAKNADGTTNTSYQGTVHFTSSDPQAVLPVDYTFTAADQGVHTFSATLKTAGSQSITTSDTVIPSGAGTQAGITVNPAVASRFTVADFPSPVTAGTAGSFTVTAWDAYGNRATGYTGTVHLTSSDAQAVLPGNYTFTAADAGRHTFSATLKTAGTQSLTATDTAHATVAGSQSVTVNPAAASRLLLSAPASVKAGTTFSLTARVVDAYGNVVTGYQGTVAFRSSDSTARLPRNYTFTAIDQGMHTFTGLLLRKKGNQTITITDTSNPSLTGSVIENVF